MDDEYNIIRIKPRGKPYRHAFTEDYFKDMEGYIQKINADVRNDKELAVFMKQFIDEKDYQKAMDLISDDEALRDAYRIKNEMKVKYVDFRTMNIPN